ncbi:hypothetical protein OS128_00890 [Corynebacterium sp. P5848]|uniref:GAP1-N2 domain-containing protein n=1 Tax=Corynebacterium marambiense TaxID=2765364 RepID=UPI002260D63E|nr:hypothetical protein [Corynebacterium marambiense]MCX7541476.1 hypothetical protein [Corynebacterium marambiense]
MTRTSRGSTSAISVGEQQLWAGTSGHRGDDQMTQVSSPRPGGRWAQVTFASFGASASRRTGGWQTGPYLDASPEQREWIKQNAVTQLSPLEPISDYISDEQVDALPRCFSYLPEVSIGGAAASVYLQAVPAGRDSTNRQGNIFTHAFVDSQPWSDGSPQYPVDCFGSPDFLRPFTIKMVDNVQLARTPTGGPRPSAELVPTAGEAIEFILCDERRAAALYRIQDALQSQVSTVVLPVPDRAAAASWLKAVSVTMSPLEAQRLLRFSTFMRGNTVSAVRHGGGAPALVCVPDVDVHLVPARPDVTVISVGGGGVDPRTDWSMDTAEFLIGGGHGPCGHMDDIIDAFREVTEPLRDRNEVPRFGAGLAAFRGLEPGTAGRTGDNSRSGVGATRDGSFSWGEDQPDSGIAGETADRGGVLSAAVDLDGFGEPEAAGRLAGRSTAIPAAGVPQVFGDAGWGDSGTGESAGAGPWGADATYTPDPADPAAVWETRVIDELRSLGCTGDGWKQPTGERKRIPEIGRCSPAFPTERVLAMLYAGISGSLVAAGTDGCADSTACVDATVEMLDVAVSAGLIDPGQPPAEIRAAVMAHGRAVMDWFAADGCPSLDQDTRIIVSEWWSNIVESDTGTMLQLLGNPGSLTSSTKRESLGFPGATDGLRRIEVLGYRVLHDSGPAPAREAVELYSLVAGKLAQQLRLHPDIVPVRGPLLDRWDDWYSQWENRERIDTIIRAANDSGYSALNFAASFGPPAGIDQIITRLRAGYSHLLAPPGDNHWPLSGDIDALLALLRLRFTVADFGYFGPLLSADGKADREFRRALDHMLIEVVDWSALDHAVNDTVIDEVRDFYFSCLRNDLATATADRAVREKHRKMLEAENERLGNPEIFVRNRNSQYWAVRRQIIEFHLSTGSTPAGEERQ